MDIFSRKKKENGDIEMTRMSRSKDEEPQEETEYRPINWRRILLSPKYIPWHILFIVIAVATVLLTIYHDNVVEKLRPFSEQVRDLPAGWLVPIVILIIISFPPLFGHEIVAVLCGAVYGLWVGFALVAAGTFLGEVGTWFAFKYALRRRALKMERTNLNYGAMARITRDGGFWVVLFMRLSAVPSHLSTAVFSACDVNFGFFVIATFLSLPKQIFLVYLGVLLLEKGRTKKTETIVFACLFLVTIVMAAWIGFKMRTVKKILLEEQVERKLAKGKAQEDVEVVIVEPKMRSGSN